jgi:hypothetical protein
LALTPLKETPPPLYEAAVTFRASLTLRVVTLPSALAPEEALLAGKARAVLIIPSRFERELRRGLPTEALL